MFSPAEAISTSIAGCLNQIGSGRYLIALSSGTCRRCRARADHSLAA